jgi:hypothetical protein
LPERDKDSPHRLKTLARSVVHSILDENEQPLSVNDYIDFPFADILHLSGHVAPTPLLTIMEDVERLKSMSLLASPSDSIDGSIHHDSETNVDNDPLLHHLTQNEVALVNEQAASDPNEKDLSDAFQQDFEELMLHSSPLAATTPPVDVA